MRWQQLHRTCINTELPSLQCGVSGAVPFRVPLPSSLGVSVKGVPRDKRIEPPRNLVAEKIDDELVVFSWDVAPPPVELTSAERDVLARVARGESNQAIASARKTSVRTIANQVASLLRKTGATSRYDLIRRFGGYRGV
jgi:DNA-binding NarL/FixJ family response regulator